MLLGKEVWQAEGSGEVHCARGKGIGREERFRGDVEPLEDFTKNLQFLPTPPQLWVGRKGPFSPDNAKMCQWKLGELRWVATGSRPGIRARLAMLTSGINSLCGSDVYRINELGRAVKELRIATVLEYASSCRQRRTLGGVGNAKDDLCNRG